MSRSISIAVVVLLSGGVASAQWYQWPVSEGGSGHWYRVTDSAGTWHEVEANAVLQGGHLATVNDNAERQWIEGIAEFAAHDALWIGFTDQDVEGTWVWVAGDGGTWTRTENPPCTGPCDGEGTAYVDWHNEDPNDNAVPPGEDWCLIGLGLKGYKFGDYGPTSANYYDHWGLIERTVRPVPTVSEWGLITMALLIIAAGGWVLSRRRGFAQAA